MKKKIKRIGIVEPVGGHGGMDYYDYGLAMGLASQNIDVTLYTSSETTPRNYDGVNTVLCFRRMWKRNILIKSYKYIAGHIYAYLDLKKKDGKIVHLHFFAFRLIDLLVLFLAKIFNLKAVVTVHDVKSFSKESNNYVEKLCYRLIDGVIVHNQYSHDQIVKCHKLSCPVSIIPHGNYLPFITKCQSIDISRKGISLLFFGQIKEVKGVDLLLESLNILLQSKPDLDIRLTIAGKPWKSDLAKYTDIIRKNGLDKIVETRFEYVPDDEISALFENSDVVMLPYREIYQSGVVLLAMSYGRPVICSDLPAFTNIIEDNVTGFIFDRENSARLAEKIEYVLNNKSLLPVVIANSDSLITGEFDWKRIGFRLSVFYDKIC